MLEALFGGLTLATGGVAGVLGSVLGIAARLLPEITKQIQDRRDKAHELAMMRLQIDSADKLAKLRMDEARQVEEYRLEGKGLDALTEALKGQFAVASGWAANLSASVRPVATYWLLALYTAHKFAIGLAAALNGADTGQVARLLWTADDIALFSAVMNFWFLDRVFRGRARA